MNENIIQNKLIGCITDTCHYDKQIKLTDRLKNDLGLDSLDIVSLICDVENSFNVTFESSDLSFNKIKTVKDLLNLILKSIKDETI